jgi:serine protease Do
MNLIPKILLLAPLFCTLTLYSFCHASTAEPDNNKNHLIQVADTFVQIIEKAKPAVVYIQVKKKSEKSPMPTDDVLNNDPVLREFFGNPSKKQNYGLFKSSRTVYGFGSGFIFNSEGYILTNNHVIADAVEVNVTLADKTKHPATIIGTDKKTDIGLIKINKTNLPVIPLGDSDKQKTGHWVLAIGSPYEFIQTVTAGIISATGRNVIGISDYENFIQTDAAINPGNSGGPLINIHGQAIGINTAFLTQTGGYMGIGFAIPINIARKVSEQLMKEGKVTRAWLGVALKDANADQLIEQGLVTTTRAAMIVQVKKDSPARLAGLLKGDLITAINDTPIANSADLRNRISLTAPQSEVTLEYYRNTTNTKIKVMVGRVVG